MFSAKLLFRAVFARPLCAWSLRCVERRIARHSSMESKPRAGGLPALRQGDTLASPPHHSGHVPGDCGCEAIRKEDLGCAICLETLQDPFVTACGAPAAAPPTAAACLPGASLPPALAMSLAWVQALFGGGARCLLIRIPPGNLRPACRPHLLLPLPGAAPAAPAQLPRLRALPHPRPHPSQLPAQQGVLLTVAQRLRHSSVLQSATVLVARRGAERSLPAAPTTATLLFSNALMHPTPCRRTPHQPNRL